MTDFRIKPVVSAGFSIFLGGVVLFGGAAASAQDYIDVEAEREAARRNGAAQSVPVYSSSNDSTAQAGTEIARTPDTGPQAASTQPDNDYSVPGIRPYSGQTTMATPSPVAGSGAGVTNTPATSAGVDVGSLVVQLQQLQEEVLRLNGIVEEQGAQIRQLKEQSLERYVDLDRRLADLGTGAATTPAQAGGSMGMSAGSIGSGTTQATGSGSAAAANSKTPIQPGEEAAYQAAYDFVKARNFARAVDAFKGFLGNYPFGRYAPNAHYWLGELYLVIDPPDPELARQSFKLLLDQYPDNPKVPDALYKLGKVYFLKGNRERSREYLERVIAQYPGHPAAQLAQDFIRENF